MRQAILREGLRTYGTIPFVHFGNAAVVAPNLLDSMASMFFPVSIAS